MTQFKAFAAIITATLVVAAAMFGAGVAPVQAVSVAALVVGGLTCPAAALILAVAAGIAAGDTSKVQDIRIYAIVDKRLAEREK